MAEGEEERGTLRIGALSRRVGVSPPVLRAWESRYGLLQPDRSEGGFRLYSGADESAVRAMKRHMARGLSTAQAAEAALEERAATGPGPAPDAPGGGSSVGDALADALLRFDEAEAQSILDRAFALQPLEEVLSGPVMDCLRRIGDGWQRGDVAVSQEHFASNVLRARLVALGRGWDAGTGRPVVLACAPGELHDIGLVCFGLALWRRGWRIVYLGQTTPVSDMREALSSVGAAALVVHVHSEELLGRSDAQLGELAEDVALALSGGGASPAAAARLGAELLEGDPVEAAIAAERRWQSLRASR